MSQSLPRPLQQVNHTTTRGIASSSHPNSNIYQSDPLAADTTTVRLSLPVSLQFFPLSPKSPFNVFFFFLMIGHPPRSTLFPHRTLFRSISLVAVAFISTLISLPGGPLSPLAALSPIVVFAAITRFNRLHSIMFTVTTIVVFVLVEV